MYKPPKINRFESTLLSVTDLTSTVKEFTFSVPHDFVFYPGQFATILFEVDGKKYRRPYSIASTPLEAHEKKHIRLCIKEVVGGPGTIFLWSRKVGDIVNMLGPLGVFVIKDEQRSGPLVFISTGTGVAPFTSMIADLLDNGFAHNITLFCGYRHELLYHKQLCNFAQKYNNFNYHPTLSQPADAGYTGKRGRVQEHITAEINTITDEQIPSAATTNYYICGLYEMIEQTARALADTKIPRENIHFERYD